MRAIRASRLAAWIGLCAFASRVTLLPALHAIEHAVGHAHHHDGDDDHDDDGPRHGHDAPEHMGVAIVAAHGFVVPAMVVRVEPAPIAAAVAASVPVLRSSAQPRGPPARGDLDIG